MIKPQSSVAAELTEVQLQKLLPELLKTQPFHSKNGSQMQSLVWKFHHLGQDYALKLSKAKSQQAAKFLYREHEFLAVIDHPQIARLVWHGMVNQHYGLITPWLPGVLLHDAHHQLAQFLPNHQARLHCFLNIKAMVEYLHQQHIYHRDLWAKNIIIHQATPYLFDFGWAAWANEPTPFTPPQMRAPDDVKALAVLRQQLGIEN